MKYNILKNHVVISNTDIGDVSLNYKAIDNLLSNTDEPVYGLNSGTVLCLDCNLSDRISISDFKYYFTGEGSLDVIASGITFEYKHNYFEDYTPLNTYHDNNYFYTDSLAGSNAPSYIRLTHSGTTNSGTVYGLEALNDDSSLSFGEDGSLEDKYISCSRGIEKVVSIPVYNNNGQRGSAYVQLDPKGINVDNYIYISDSEEGPWKSINDYSYKILNSKNFDTAIKEMTDVEIEDDVLIISGKYIWGKWTSNKEKGSYTTKLFKVPQDAHYSNIMITDKSSDLGTRLMIDDTDTHNTMKICSFKEVEPYYAYRELFEDGSDNRIRFRDISMKDDTSVIFQQQSENFSEYGNDDYYGGRLNDYWVEFDSQSNWSAILIKKGYEVLLYLLDSDDNIYSSIKLVDTGSDTFSFTVYDVKLDIQNGIWLYIYVSVGNSSYELTDAGYYLMHISRDMDVLYKKMTYEKDIYGFALEYNSREVWYTAEESKTIRLIDAIGNILVEFEEGDVDSNNVEILVDNLKDCCISNDGSCWYVNDNYIIKLSSAGNFLGYFNTENLVPGNNTPPSIIEEYNDSILLVCKGDTVTGMDISDTTERGSLIFKQSVPFTNSIFTVNDKGVWVHSLNGYFVFLETNSGAPSYKIMSDKESSYYRVPGYIMKTPEDEDFITKFPVAFDDKWTENNFSKVSINNYLLYRYDYNQIKFVLRVNKPYSKYNVPDSISEWLIDDSFNNEVGYNKPYQHRWITHEDVYTEYKNETINTISGSVDFQGGVCMFSGNSDPLLDDTQYIESKERWYFEDVWNDGNYNFKFDFIIPEENADDFVLGIKVSPTDDYDHSREKLYIKREGDSFYAGYEMYGYYLYQSYTSNHRWGGEEDEVDITNSFTGYGTINVVHTGSMVYMYIAHSFGSFEEVLSFSRNYDEGMDFGGCTTFFVKFEYDGYEKAYISNFVGYDNDIYWFFDSPRISDVSINNSIKTSTIYPSNYQNIYLKMEFPSDVKYLSEETNNYELKTWWELYE